MTPSTIQYIVDSFLSSIQHIALYIEHLDITNQVETLVINKKDLVFIELVETEGNIKEDYINNYLLKVELQSDTIIYISPSNISSIQPLTKEQYNRAVEKILGKVDEKKSEKQEQISQQEEDNSIELDIDLSEKEDEEDFPYNPDEAITYITTDIAKLSAYLSTPQVDQNNNYNNNIYNNKMYNILKKLSKLFKPIKQQQQNNYNNDNIYTTTKGIQKINTIKQQQQNSSNNINTIKQQQQNSSNNINTIKQQQQNIKKYETILKQLNISKTYIQQYQNSLYNIINSLYNIINLLSNLTKKEIKQQLYNIVDKYKQYKK